MSKAVFGSSLSALHFSSSSGNLTITEGADHLTLNNVGQNQLTASNVKFV